MARRLLILAFAFLAMVVGIEGIRRAVDWWNGVLPAPTYLDYAAMASLPLIGWLWWRYLSPFARGRGQCLAHQKPQSRSAIHAPIKK